LSIETIHHNKTMENYQVVIKIQEEFPYAAFRRTVAQQDIPNQIPPLIGALVYALEKLNININGDCFFRYLSCSHGGQIVVEAGFPIEPTDSKAEDIEFGVFPAGKYLSVTHMGDYKNLYEAHMYLEKHAKQNNLILDEYKTDAGVVWGCRVEKYLTEPELTPIADWKTEVAFLFK
jgi:RNA polymerase sigma-70 factor, ECF subfamily